MVLIVACDSALVATLFPVFASYKAIKDNDISQLKPWLMFWVVFGVFGLAESWTWWFLVWYVNLTLLRVAHDKLC
jgi:hypothetical protein